MCVGLPPSRTWEPDETTIRARWKRSSWPRSVWAPPTPAELARLQDRLRRREAALRAVLEGLPDATVAAGSDGRIVFANAHAEALFGYEHDAAAGPARAGAVARAPARALHAQHGALLRDRPSAALHDPRRRAAPRRQRVRGRDELGDRRDRGRAAAAGDRARHDRAPRGAEEGAAPVAPGRGGRGAGRAGAGGRGRRRPGGRGGRAAARDAAAGAGGDLARRGGARRLRARRTRRR